MALTLTLQWKEMALAVGISEKGWCKSRTRKSATLKMGQQLYHCAYFKFVNIFIITHCACNGMDKRYPRQDKIILFFGGL